jgi:hypothetical protein
MFSPDGAFEAGVTVFFAPAAVFVAAAVLVFAGRLALVFAGAFVFVPDLLHAAINNVLTASTAINLITLIFLPP